MATGDRYKTGYKITAVEQADGSYASQTIIPPASSVRTEGTFPVGTTSAVLVTANANRRSLYIQNDSEEVTVYLKSGTGPAVVGQGWRLSPGNGITYEHGQAVHAIASTPTEVSILEENV